MHLCRDRSTVLFNYNFRHVALGVIDVKTPDDVPAFDALREGPQLDGAPFDGPGFQNFCGSTAVADSDVG